jgi:hypothetical protein
VVLGLPLHLLQPVVQTPPPSGCISRPASSPKYHHHLHTPPTLYPTPLLHRTHRTRPHPHCTHVPSTPPKPGPALVRLVWRKPPALLLQPALEATLDRNQLAGSQTPPPICQNTSQPSSPFEIPIHLHFCLSRPSAIQSCFQPLTTSTRRICLGFDTLYTTQYDYRNPDCRRHRLRLSVPRCCHNTLVILPTHQPDTPKEPSEPRILLQHHL